MRKTLIGVYFLIFFLFYINYGCNEKSKIKKLNENISIKKNVSDQKAEIIKLDNKKDGQTCLKGKKIFVLESYSADYVWNKYYKKGLNKAIKCYGIDYKVFHMDTKNHRDKLFREEMGKKAKDEIEQYKPDLIIAFDDNAQKYCIVPYFKNKNIPVVFAGVNWDADSYGYPLKNNITGMIEVDLGDQFKKILKKYVQGKRIAFIADDSTTVRKNLQNYYKYFFSRQEMKAYLVKDYEEFKEKYIEAQKNADFLIFYNQASIKGWNDNIEDVKKFLLENTTIPTGATLPWMKDYVVLNIARDTTEQGEWAGLTALKILKGTKPSEIPIVKNNRMSLTINMKLAKKSNIVFNKAILKIAKIIK